MIRVNRVRATAFAKLTLSLRVLGRRDDGFHELEALAVSLGQPHDTIEAAVVSEPGLTIEVVGDDPLVPEGDDNLAIRAADRVMMRAGRHALGVHLTLRKRIRAGGGLGGGSADAAATLLAVRHLLELDVDDAALSDLATGLGSDVPFCLTGGTAWMRGRGEIIDPVDLPHGVAVLVATPPFGLATARVYRMRDEMGGPRAQRRVPAPGRIARVVAELSNDLEPAAEALEPQLREFRERLEAITGQQALLAGSGSSYVVPVEGGPGLTDLAERVGRELRAVVFASATVSRGVRLEV